MRIAVIADIHSNAPALEAVISDLNKRNVDLTVQLGDAFNGPIAPKKVIEILRSTEMIHIKGNGERLVLSDDPEVCKGTAKIARNELTEEELAWIDRWPKTFKHKDFFACHGTPLSDLDYLLEHPLQTGSCLKTSSEIEKAIDGIEESLILCAHSHIARSNKLNSNQWVLNPGSVGLPAYSDDLPLPHKMESGSPDARYAVAEKVKSGWIISLMSIPYDFEVVASTAKERGFHEWAYALKTGYSK